jgi:2-dehydro-3-deoxygalactonokinase
MRGEETELIGLFASRNYDAVARGGILILPGTHSKHVRLRDRRVWDFQTFMTGELFDVLSSHSLLRASIESAGTIPFDHPDSRAAFEQGVRLNRDPGLAASLFQVRTRTVLNGVAPEVNRWFLSGLLIGSEIVTLVSEGNSTPILLAATETVAAPYRVALECLELGERLELVPADLMNTASTLGHLNLFRRGIGAS